MSTLLQNVTNGIWHAFMALNCDQTAAMMVGKSKLKVLTANIASIFDLYGVEKGLEHYRSTSALLFDHFQYYLLQEVFAMLPSGLTLSEMRNYEARIEEICWLICRRKYAVSSNFPVPEPLRFKLFRIFCMLADFVTRNGRSSQCEVLLHASEAAQIVQQVLLAMGLDSDTDRTYNELSTDSCAPLSFDQFLQLFAFDDYTLLEGSERTESMAEAIEELYQTYINDIVKKGYLLRRGYLLPTLKEYWFVLQPCELTFYKNATQRDLCGSIALDANSCMVRPTASNNGSSLGRLSAAASSALPSSASSPSVASTTSSSHSSSSPASTSSSSGDKHRRFSLTAHDRHFELAAADHRTRLQWIAALQLAITYSTGGPAGGYQRDQVARRRKRRELEQRRRSDQELQRTLHLAEVQTTRTQLELEREARCAAEAQARELELVVREDSRRVAELEDVKVTLERLLLEETQAKRDEEIVRALQARVLAEEWEKRAELEQLQEEQRVVLEREREKRRTFEEIQREREQRLRDAEQRLKQLEEEREKLDLELRQARAKIVHSEQNKVAMEKRLQLGAPLREQGVGSGGGGGGDRLRRALSFMHSNRERTFAYDVTPRCLPARARSKSPAVVVQTSSTNVAPIG